MKWKKKYKLRLGKLDFISPVDRPAQETAVALMLKRARGKISEIGSPRSFYAEAKKFSEDLGLVFCWAFTCKVDGVEYFDLHGDNILEDDIVKIAAEFMENSRAVDEMHDGVAAGTTVFAMPWTGDVAKAFLGIDDPGTTGLMVAIKPPPEVFAKFKSGEYTGVSIGAWGYREEIEDKRAGASDDDDDQRQFSKRGLLTSDDDGHSHIVDDEVIGGAGHTSWESYGPDSGHSHPYVIDEGGTITIGASRGHTHTVRTVPVEMRAPTPVGQSSNKADPPADNTRAKETDMDELTKMKALVARLQKMVALTDAEKAFLNALDEQGQDEFLAKSAADRAAQMTAALEADPVVYTSKSSGKQYRRSTPTEIVEAAKATDEAKAETAAARAEKAAVAVNKRSDELASLPNPEVEVGEGVEKRKLSARAELVKAVQSIADETVRKAVDGILTAADRAMSEFFKTHGTLEGGTGAEEIDGSNALATLNKMAAEYAAKHNIPQEAAFIKVTETDEGKALYDAHTAAQLGAVN